MGPLPSLPTKQFGTYRPPPLVATSLPPTGPPLSKPPPAAPLQGPTSTNISPTKRRRASATNEPRVLRKSPRATAVARANQNSTHHDTIQVRNDRLGTLVRDIAAKFQLASSWEEFICNYRGPSYLSTELDELDHPASAVLQEWRDHGVPVHTSSDPWSPQQKDECIQRGCHHSAN